MYIIFLTIFYYFLSKKNVFKERLLPFHWMTVRNQLDSNICRPVSKKADDFNKIFIRWLLSIDNKFKVIMFIIEVKLHRKGNFSEFREFEWKIFFISHWTLKLIAFFSVEQTVAKVIKKANYIILIYFMWLVEFSFYRLVSVME